MLFNLFYHFLILLLFGFFTLPQSAIAMEKPQSCAAAIKAQVEQLSKNPETQLTGNDLLPLLADVADCLDQTEFKTSHLEKVEGAKVPLMLGEVSQ